MRKDSPKSLNCIQKQGYDFNNRWKYSESEIFPENSSSIKRKSIPQLNRYGSWEQYLRDAEKGICIICEERPIYKNNGFHAAHIIPKAVIILFFQNDFFLIQRENGPDEVWNLIPICARCNGNSQENMFDVIAKNIRWRKRLKPIFLMKFIFSIDTIPEISEISLMEFVENVYHPSTFDKYKDWLKLKEQDFEKITSIIGDNWIRKKEENLEVEVNSTNDRIFNTSNKKIKTEMEDCLGEVEWEELNKNRDNIFLNL